MRLRCRISGHLWQPYGPPPRYADYLPHVVRCDRCLGYQLASGDPLDAALLQNVRPYPPPPDDRIGWTRYGSG
jgi:hypothetical protein